MSDKLDDMKAEAGARAEELDTRVQFRVGRLIDRWGISWLAARAVDALAIVAGLAMVPYGALTGGFDGLFTLLLGLLFLLGGVFGFVNKLGGTNE